MKWLVFILVVVGAINWGLIGFFNFDLVATLFGLTGTLTRVIYGLVGLAGLYMLFTYTTWMGRK